MGKPLNISRTLLTVVLTSALVACSGNTDNDATTEGPPDSSSEATAPEAAAPETTAPETTAADTALAPVDPIPGWEKFTGGGVELWLPESFEGGDTETDLPIILERMKQLGPEFEQIAQGMEQNAAAFALFIFDEEVGESGFLTNVNVVAEQVLETLTVETYLDLVAAQLPEQIRIIEQGIVSREGRDVGRFVSEFDQFGAKQLIYVVKDGSTIWTLTFSTGISEFEERLEIFEQSAETFAKAGG